MFDTHDWLAVIGILFSGCTALFSFLATLIVWFIKRGEDQQNAHIMNLLAEVSRIDTVVARCEPQLNAEHTQISGIATDLKDHVQREEQVFWAKIEALGDAQRISNEAVLQRISSLEARMPNGEITEIRSALSRLEGAVGMMTQEVARVAKHVDDHDSEATMWKTKITANETRLSAIEKANRGRRATR